MKIEVKQPVDYYGREMQQRRDTFNRIIRGMDMVLMNKIPEVDESVWDNWQDKSPIEQLECEWFLNDGKPVRHWCCDTHMFDGTGEYPSKLKKSRLDTKIINDDITDEHPVECDFAEPEPAEVYQWFAVGDSDADYLKSHNQYVTYSDLLDTYFLAICHFGTSWDYVDSMVDDILGDK